MKTVVFAAVACALLLASAPVAAQEKSAKKPAPVAAKKSPPSSTDVAGGALLVGGVSIGFIVVCLMIGFVCLVMYFLPVCIALIRKHPDSLAICAVCILFGWSFLGWVSPWSGSSRVYGNRKLQPSS